jgi:hypothetical protein
VNSFAGFWRDGAVVKPEEKHWSCCKCIFAIQKDDNSLDICLHNFDEWETVHWLDTTTPTELSPQEAFELCKLLHPTLTSIQRVGESGFGLNTYECGAQVNWGNTTEYPPKQRWRMPTDADKGKQCRVSNDNDCFVMERTFIATFNDAYIVANSEHKISCWNYCEVRSET